MNFEIQIHGEQPAAYVGNSQQWDEQVEKASVAALEAFNKVLGTNQVKISTANLILSNGTNVNLLPLTSYASTSRVGTSSSGGSGGGQSTSGQGSTRS